MLEDKDNNDINFNLLFCFTLDHEQLKEEVEELEHELAALLAEPVCFNPI